MDTPITVTSDAPEVPKNYLTRGERHVARANRRRQFAIRCSLQGLAAKAGLCLLGKGRNGKSMSPQLADRHLNFR